VGEVQGSIQVANHTSLVGDRLREDLKPLQRDLEKQGLKGEDLRSRLGKIHFKRKTFESAFDRQWIQESAAIRMLFDYLVTAQVIPFNSAAAVRGPKHVVKRGKTPVLKAEQARALLDSISLKTIVGLRDRAILGVMCYTFARVGAVVAMRVEDYYENGKRGWFRLHEKGGKRHEVPVHHNAEAYMDAYIEAADIAGEKKTPLFRSVDKSRKLTERPMDRNDVLRMIKRRAKQAGLPYSTCCHTFRETGIITYLENGETIENAQAIAAHESPRTTKLYDRTGDEITLDEVERISI